jgi:hypothetical protein
MAGVFLLRVGIIQNYAEETSKISSGQARPQARHIEAGGQLGRQHQEGDVEEKARERMAEVIYKAKSAMFHDGTSNPKDSSKWNLLEASFF